MEDGLFEGVAGQTAVAGGAGVVSLTAGVVVPQRFLAGLRDGVALVFCEDVGDLQQLIGGVVRELDFVGEAAGQTAVGGEEGLHLSGVSGQNDHKLVVVVFHPFDEGINGFEAEAVLLAAVEAVSLVDEEDAPRALSMTLLVSGAVWPV